MKVIFLCILMGNPYADRLGEALAPYEVDVKVEESNFGYIFLPKVLNTQNINILHFHTLHYFLSGSNPVKRWIRFLIFIAQLIVLKILKIRIVWTVHEWADRFGNGRNRIYPIWSIVLGQFFDAIIAHCDSTKTEIEQAFRLSNTNRVSVVPHGNYIGAYDNHLSREEARQMLRITEQNLVFLLFGDIHRTKGFLEAIDAFKKLEAPNLSLLVVGQPVGEQLAEELKNKTRSCPNILFIPKHVSNEEIQIYMNASDCVIIPYKVSTTSGVTILAMSFGKACIAPKVGFFQDVLNAEGAFLYEPRLQDALFDAMEAVVKKCDLLVEMGKHNRRIAQQWNWDTVAHKTANVYKHCFGKDHQFLSKEEREIKLE